MDFRPDVPLGVLPDRWTPYIELQAVCYAVLCIIGGFSLSLLFLSAFVFSKREHPSLRSWLLWLTASLSLSGVVLFAIAGIRNRWKTLSEMLCAVSENGDGCYAPLGNMNPWGRSISFVQVLLPLLSDGVIVYRTSLIWRKRLLSVLMSVSWFASFVLGILTIVFSYHVVLVRPNSTIPDLILPLSSYVSYGFICSSTLTNILASGFTAAKLMGHRRYMKIKLGILQPMSSNGQRILVLLVESGFAYCLVQVAYTVLVTIYSVSVFPSSSSIAVAQIYFTAISGLYPGLVQYVLNVLTAYPDNPVVGVLVKSTLQ